MYMHILDLFINLSFDDVGDGMMHDGLVCQDVVSARDYL